MLDGRKLFAGCTGWAGNKNSGVFKYVNGIQNWQLGFGTAWLDGDDIFPTITSISDDGRAVFEGRVYRG